MCGADGVAAEQTIYHDREHPSRVELPIVQMADLEELTIPDPVPERDDNAIAK